MNVQTSQERREGAPTASGGHPQRSKPSITLAAQSFRGSSGGIARVCELSARALLDYGAQLSMLSVQDDSGTFQDIRGWRRCGGSRAKFALACAQATLRREHILFDQLGSARAHILPYPFAGPAAAWIHGIEVWYELRRDRLKAARRMDFMIANTNFTRVHAAERDKVFQSARVCWLATWEDDPPAQSASLDGPPIVMILGRLDNAAYKGHQELIEAWPTVISAVPGARLAIVGTGPSLGKHASLVAASSAAPFIDLCGFVDEADMLELWRRTVVFAMPSRGEGFGLAYIEAMRWGIPVIASVHDAGSEINVDGETGVNVDLSQKGGLADALVQILRDRDLARQFGQAGQRRWSEHFNYRSFRARFWRELEHFLV
jgi:phosphatidyl-myo-inositol dimannoside synthase